MTNFTQKQQAYIEARIAGHNRTQSAIHAGYSPAGADRQGSNLEKRADIKAAIAKGKRSTKQTVTPAAQKRGRRGDEEDVRMLPKYKSSLELLKHTYNNPKMPDSVRMRAAEQALPYEHARVGEKGKKEQAGDRAREVASAQRGKFSPKRAPATRVLN